MFHYSKCIYDTPPLLVYRMKTWWFIGLCFGTPFCKAYILVRGLGASGGRQSDRPETDRCIAIELADRRTRSSIPEIYRFEPCKMLSIFVAKHVHLNPKHPFNFPVQMSLPHLPHESGQNGASCGSCRRPPRNHKGSGRKKKIVSCSMTNHAVSCQLHVLDICLR